MQYAKQIQVAYTRALQQEQNGSLTAMMREATTEARPLKNLMGFADFFSRNGTCKFGANCKFKHEEGGKSKPTKKVRFSAKGNKQVKALKVKVVKQIKQTNVDDIDELVRGFLVARTIPRETMISANQTVTAMSSCPFDMSSFAYDTGAGEGVSTSEDDFTYLDTSEQEKNSVTIHGPTIGTPTCQGRGPLVFTYRVGEKVMGLIHSNGILASSFVGSTQLRLASAMQMKKKGVRYLGGKFNDDDIIECVRTGEKIPAREIDGILIVRTNGVAKDIQDSIEFQQLVKDIESGLRSPC
jgi:hypothetical protein